MSAPTFPTTRTVRLLALSLSASLGVVGLTAASSLGADPAAGGRATALAAAHAAVHADADRKHKKKKKHHHTKIKNRKLGIPSPHAVTGPAANQASITWSKTKGANRYSVLWSSGPYGKWPGPTTYVGPKWLSGSTRSATLDISGLGAYQLSPAYGNPVFMDLWADNSRDRAPRHKSKYVAVWPQIATPAAGAAVRLGQYNLDGISQNWGADAQNIAASGANIVAVQETNGSRGDGGRQVASALGWGIVNPEASEAILYNPSVFSSCSSSLVAGWSTATCTTRAGSKTFRVTSVHYGGTNAQTGAAAQATANALPNDGMPTIIAGDFTSNREPYGSAEQAQPVLVRNGFWDAQASLSRVNANYSTFNGHKTASPNPSGQGTRADYIMMRGINGSFAYHNVVNTYGNPSDHNLIWADIQIP
ncbi:hypothetical protein D9V37_12010 [Nocardioides mangrovicus]|uniref:Endonuclease/exonuclease/phosphatase domain-containing protein n=1 Tax=Nocardioides mangrovicus TaxID=2478913 RepID=A0A3L8P286_9ACTN|nr:hypothetical protein [Nocardioides mangrovicus]RLV49264.1 hypothetical protein D9V37_12010 [Nocardioides mangrovicus]